jgi:hypothetical protein
VRDGVGVEEALDSVVSDDDVSVGDRDGGVGEGATVVGRKKVGEGDSIATAVGSGRTPAASSSLNRNPPNSIPTLMSVMARLLSTCSIPVVWSAAGRGCSLTDLPLALLASFRGMVESDTIR